MPLTLQGPASVDPRGGPRIADIDVPDAGRIARRRSDRLWSRCADSHLRRTTRATTEWQSIARDYAAEGHGPDAVAMCAPLGA